MLTFNNENIFSLGNIGMILYKCIMHTGMYTYRYKPIATVLILGMFQHIF